VKITIHFLTEPAELIEFISHSGIRMSEKIPDTLNEKSDAPAHVGLTSRGISEGAFAPGDGDRNVIDIDADVTNVFL
jgi:hypothetical protein